MLLFRSEDHIDRWSKAWRMGRGASLSIEQAWRLADAWYRDRLSGNWRRRTGDEAHALFHSLGLTTDFWRFS